MNSQEPDISVMIDNEMKRVKIQNHPKFSAWHASLQPHARQIVDQILEDDITPELIIFAQEVPDDERDAYQFISMIAGGNPVPHNLPGLTSITFIDILLELRDFTHNA